MSFDIRLPARNKAGDACRRLKKMVLRHTGEVLRRPMVELMLAIGVTKVSLSIRPQILWACPRFPMIEIAEMKGIRS